MRLRLYSIRDRLAGVFLTPFPARADVEAVRQITASFADPQFRQTPVFQNPKDFDLMFVGEFDDESGEISPASPKLLKNLDDFSPPSTVTS